jgi:hypothetical protein
MTTPKPPEEITRAEWELRGNAPMTRKQQKLLNAVCGDLQQLRWHGIVFSKDDFRHLVSAVVLGERLVPGVNTGEGAPGLIRMARSSLELTKTQATQAIRMALDIGDNPADQGLPDRPVRWSDTVLHALGFNPDELRSAA